MLSANQIAGFLNQQIDEIAPYFCMLKQIRKKLKVDETFLGRHG